MIEAFSLIVTTRSLYYTIYIHIIQSKHTLPLWPLDLNVKPNGKLLVFELYISTHNTTISFKLPQFVDFGISFPTVPKAMSLERCEAEYLNSRTKKCFSYFVNRECK